MKLGTTSILINEIILTSGECLTILLENGIFDLKKRYLNGYF